MNNEELNNECDETNIAIICPPRRKVPPRLDQGDFKCLKCIFKIGKYCGTTPFALRNQTGVSISSRIIGFILLSYNIIQTYFVVKLKLVDFANMNALISGLSYLLTLAEFLFVVYSIFTLTFRRDESWRKLFREIITFENTIIDCDNFNIGKQYLLFLQLGLVYFLVVSGFSGRFYLYLTAGEMLNVLKVSTSLVSETYIVIFISYYVILTNWMKNRFNIMDKYLNDSLKTNKTDIKRIVILFKSANEIVTHINDILGNIMFYSICVTVIFFLYCFTFALDDIRPGLDWKIMNFFVSLTYLVSLVVLVMACELVEQSGNKIIKTCFNLHESIDDEPVQEQLQLLAQYAEQWKPRFSAGGFYNINQSCLSSVFSAIITYLVIIIQFNMVLVEEEEDVSKNLTVRTFR